MLILAAAVRALALYHGTQVVAPMGDEYYYLEQGTSLAAGQGHPGSFRPPLYSFLIGAVFATFGRDLLLARLVQIVLSLVAVAAVHEICRERFGRRAALWSGLAMALSPRLAHYTHFLWAETLFITLFLLFVWALHRFDRGGGRASLVSAGVMLGLAALTKEIVVFYALLLLPWFVWRSRGDWKSSAREAALFLGCFVLVLLPWMIRNQAINGAFVGLSNCRWFPIATGNLRAEDAVNGTNKRVEFLEEWRAVSDERERESLSRSVALESIRSQQPVWAFRKLRLNTPRLFSPKSQELRFIEMGLYAPDLATSTRRFHVLVSLVGHLLLLGPGLAAFWLVRGDRLLWPLLTMIGYSIFVYMVANATPRFLLPLLPLAYLYVGPLVARVSLDTRRWRVAGALATVALFLAFVLMQIPTELGPAWNGLIQR